MKMVMTGATSGFGLDAVKRLLHAGMDDIVVGARTPSDLPEGLRNGAVTALHLDLENLSSVRSFAGAIGPEPIDLLVLNAGMQLAKPERASNGMEKTFLVNQLSHFLLLRLLEDRLADDARVIFTGSGTHDPAEGTPVTPPRHADAMRLAYPERDDTLPEKERDRLLRAYSSSKLTNIMTARELARRNPDLTVMSFDPGYVPGTGLGREYPWVLQKAMGAIIPFMMQNDRTSSIANTGFLYARLMVDPDRDGESGGYYSVRGKEAPLVEPSELARDQAAAEKLWSDCEELVGLSK